MHCSLCGKAGHRKDNKIFHPYEKEYQSPTRKIKSPSKKRHYKDPERHARFERCVLAVKKQPGARNPYAICNASIGPS